MMRSGILVALLIAFAAPPAPAVSPADKCQAAKLATAGKLQLCQAKARARAVARGGAADASRCIGHFADKWQAAELAANGACRSAGDAVAVAAFVGEQGDELAAALAGGPLLDCATRLDACSDDRARCDAALASCRPTPPGRPAATGQTTCSDSGGAPIDCAGSGQDGETQAGLTGDFFDNGDGTVTDRRTGLTWETLTDDGSIHDKDQVYTWAEAVTARITLFNAAHFAGYDDWRLPNVNELQSLADYGRDTPAIAPVFDASCQSSCAASACSCTAPLRYWTSTSRVDAAGAAWTVSFGSGEVQSADKSLHLAARAVRGGR
ncbi:MAG: DUF1566 domain-containing protein [Deltaproteobacteria bacterium]|nr:DUF1566 domain-containing protein [Deltaproteobacteria bacterium]